MKTKIFSALFVIVACLPLMAQEYVITVYEDCEQNGSIKSSTGGTVNGHDYVDLGLPSGLQWATMNIGASAPEERGSKFAWGETTTKDDFTWDNYKFGRYNSEKTKQYLTRYLTSSTYVWSGSVDNLTTLLAEDDAATVNWEATWRMPTKADWQELIDNCEWTQITINDVTICKVSGKKAGYTDRCIYIYPATYWTSILSTSNGNPYAYYAQFSMDGFNITKTITDKYNNRSTGYYIRPVIPQEQ